MYCMHCGKPSLEGSSFCSCCGRRLDAAQTPPIAQVPSPPVSAPAVPTRTGSLRAPLLILIGLSIIGFVLFFALPMDGSAPPSVSEGCWQIDGFGSVYFIPELYYGPGEITVPAQVRGRVVTSLGEQCFYDCDGISTVYLPETVTALEYQCFAKCDGLRGLHLPEGTEFIAMEAFYGCTSLEAITLPASLEALSGEAFSGCGSLRHIFYSGTMEQWNSISSDTLPAKVYCSDGTITP